jgi:hypothetical protein
MANRTVARPALPEVVISNRDLTKLIAREVKSGRAKKIGPRLYTTNTADSPADVVRRNLWVLLGQMLPDAVVGYRTALDGVPSQDGAVFLTGPYSRTIRLPGHTVYLVRGPGPLEGDSPFMGRLYIASRERALLESVAASRRRSAQVRGLNDQELQQRLERQLQIGGEEALNALRDKIRVLAPMLRAERAAARINDIIGTLLGTRRASITSPSALARLAGRPYESGRLRLFEALLAELRARPTVSRPDRNIDGDASRHAAFFDAYFSNYIEGTEFELGEAIQLVLENKLPVTRPKDAHDVIGTFRLLIDRSSLARSVASMDSDSFVALLKERHARMLIERPEVRPGQFKEQANRAGETQFVPPELVHGTLQTGFEMMRAVDDPFGKAAFVTFLVAEVHPFDDGNGRLARLFMNAELAAAGETRILVPTVYRDDYLLALRALSRQRRPQPFVAMLDRAQQFASELDFRVLPRVIEVLTACNAFDEPGKDTLRLPSELERRPVEGTAGPAAGTTYLSDHLKSGHTWTAQNRP